MKVNIYLLEWHLNFSHAFHEIFINLINGYADVRLQSWNGKDVFPEWENPQESDVFVFCQKPPPDILKRTKSFAKVLWIPMWNNVKNMTAQNWASLDKSTRILSYAPQISEKSIKAGLPTLEVCYVPAPARFSPASWENGNVMYYWNRVGMIGKSELIMLCKKLAIQKLLFRPNLDPNIPSERGYSLTSEEAGVEVETVPIFETQALAIQFINQANVFIAPRPSEGVGLTFLEAMAGGKAVLAVDQPTMSAYIEHGQTGILLCSHCDKLSNRPMLAVTVDKKQKWADLRAMNLREIGYNARQKIVELEKFWLNDIHDIRMFALNWDCLPSAACSEKITIEKLGALHRLTEDLPPQLSKVYTQKIRSFRRKLHTPFKSDLRTINLRIGLKMIVDLKDSSSIDLYYGSFNEQDDFDLFMAAINSGDVVLDVGASMGLYTISGAQRVGALGRVFAFEPNNQARDLLSKNIAINKLTKAVKIIPSCVGDYDGITHFYEMTDSVFSGIRDTRRSSIRRFIDSPITTLDSFISHENLDRVDALKLDVEGFEANVLKGAAMMLDRSDPFIMMEISNKNLCQEQVSDLINILCHLEEKGFCALRIMPRINTMKIFQSVAHILDQPKQFISGNYFLARKETGKVDQLINLHGKLKSDFGCQGRIFPGIHERRFRRFFRNSSNEWALNMKCQIAWDLLLCQKSNYTT